MPQPCEIKEGRALVLHAKPQHLGFFFWWGGSTFDCTNRCALDLTQNAQVARRRLSVKQFTQISLGGQACGQARFSNHGNHGNITKSKETMMGEDKDPHRV